MKSDKLRQLQRTDLNRLVSLSALLSAGGVSRAAELLDVSQPTMSKALTQLRDTFGDQLLVREGNAMRLTPFAGFLSLNLETVMSEIDTLLNPQGPFDPETVRGWIRIAGNDYLQSVLGLPFARRLRQVAPNLRVQIRGVGSMYPEQLLAEGIVDIALGTASHASNLHRHKAFADPFICVADADNRTLPDRLSLDAFLDLQHVDVSPTGTGILRRHFERSQRRFKTERNIVAQLNSFASIPTMIAGTSIVALLPRRMLAKLPEKRLRVIDCEFDLAPYNVTIWWHQRTHMDPLMRWARTELIDFAKTSEDGTGGR